MISHIVFGRGRRRIKVDIWPENHGDVANFLKGYLGLVKYK
jgi:hypothetical protein